MKRIIGVILTLLTAGILAGGVLIPAANAAIPQTLNYQGYLTDDAGTPVNSSVSIEFRIYVDLMATSPQWTEVHPDVPVSDGLFTVILGSGSPMSVINFNQSLWLSINVNGDGEMDPWQELTSSAYAFKAAHADRAFALDAADGYPEEAVFVDNTGNVGIGTLIPSTELEVAGTITATAFSGDGRGLTGINSPWTQNSTDVYYTGGCVGIGIADPYRALHIGGADIPGIKVEGTIGGMLTLGDSDDPAGSKNHSIYGTGEKITIGHADDTGSVFNDLNIDRQGYVGLGDSTPAANLVVGLDNTAGFADGIGDVYVQHDLEVDGLIYGDGSQLSGITVTGDDLGDHTATIDIDTDGNDVLMTDSSSQLKFTNTSDTYLISVENSDNTGIYWDVSSNEWEWRGSGVERARIDLDNGNLQTDGTLTVDGISYLNDDLYLAGGSSTDDDTILFDGKSPGYETIMWDESAQGFDISDDLNVTDTITATSVTGSSQVCIGGDCRSAWPSSGDNMGNHTATQNINLSGNHLSGDGDSEGIYVDNTGNIGIGTSNPLADLHIVGSPTMGRAIIAPENYAYENDSQLLLAEDIQGLYGMSITYEGSSNNLYISGKSLGTIYGPHLSIDRDSGAVGIGTMPAINSKLCVVGDTDDKYAGYFDGNYTDSGEIGYGVYGYADGAFGNVGVYGGAPAGGLNKAALFGGNVQINGNISKTGGSFLIDHPLDPANKYLSHSFVESPDMMNIYNGNVILDGNGESTVIFEEWFQPLNRDFRYQLTCIGGWSPVYISEKISGNQFRIAGGEAGMEVSWMVTGIRQDAWANENRIQVEEDKPVNEKGLYLHPESFGLNETLGMDYARQMEMEQMSAASAQEVDEDIPQDIAQKQSQTANPTQEIPETGDIAAGEYISVNTGDFATGLD